MPASKFRSPNSSQSFVSVSMAIRIQSLIAASLSRSSKLQLEARNLSTFISSSTKGKDRSFLTNSSIKNEILRQKNPSRSATTVLQNWIDKGHKFAISQLKYISTQLVKAKRYNQALEILKWMETQNNVRISPADHAMRVELIIKVHGLKDAEEYFEGMTNSASRKATCLPLLRGYVKERDVRKAEGFMMSLNNLGLIVSPHAYNEMMKLYLALSQFEKVRLVIMQMKRNKIPRNVLSYNLWMNACGGVFDVDKAEMVYKEMVNDKNVEVGWSSLATLANVYVKAGLVDKALLALKIAEEKLSSNGRLGYFFLITLYSSVKSREGILRLWEASKVVRGRITCANYMCILSCLVKIGDLVEAERVFMEWESNCQKYDIRVSNVLLGAYVRNGLINKAESLHLHTLERGGHPNYKTWEILMEGWVKSQKMDKAISAMKKSFSMLKHRDWRPSLIILMTIADYFEKNGNFDDANHYIRDIHNLGLASLPLYKLLLRMHLRARRSAFDILKMMEKDKIEMDEETSAIVQDIGRCS